MIELQKSIARAERAIEEIKAGKMVILVDDEDRENEGDLTMAAELVTPEAITFMATKGCGLICVTLTPKQVDRLQLPMMVATNQTSLGTAFTVSVEAASGVSTGISAADRAHTTKVCADPNSTASDLISPGHVFPLRAMPGGVLQRTGQTEGSVDLARLAGLEPAGVICEIMKSDGTMARMEDLRKFAEEHGLVVVSIADLIEYRLQHDRLVEKTASYELELGSAQKATFTAHVYEALPGIIRHEYVALTLGPIDDGQPVPIRAHVANVTDDIFGACTRPSSPSVQQLIDAIIRRGRGVLLFLPSRDTYGEQLKQALHKQSAPHNDIIIREYGIGAQILLDLGVRNLQVISNNPHKLVGLRAWGFESTTQISLEEV
ncbi:MAG: 3,4-dihydroxy-2-butanone-4-phosphate synthase [Deltaproteobacteria bacterium]|nr:3,4-dihydroxy-2-butanone-4-phosphate synthase [Deltaproteobacteria bacterium]MBN2674782.1 3,4-dihydroxy-2-butanone-4-phosphate synthase [Deltaproteobacteria bacterium]